MNSNSPHATFKLSAHSLSQIPKDRLPHVAFAGRSNVGKSSLLNSLLGVRGLAKTSSTPGRTQAINLFEIDSRYYFVDLPGYGFARAPVSAKREWSKLVDEYFQKCDVLRSVIFLIDCRRTLNEDDALLLEWLAQHQLPHVIALTKADKLGRGKLTEKVNEIAIATDGDVIPFSTKSGAGKRELWRWILNTLDRQPGSAD